MAKVTEDKATIEFSSQPMTLESSADASNPYSKDGLHKHNPETSKRFWKANFRKI